MNNGDSGGSFQSQHGDGSYGTLAGVRSPISIGHDIPLFLRRLSSHPDAASVRGKYHDTFN